MFGKKTTEFIEDHKALFKNRLNSSIFSIYGYRLGIPANRIDISRVKETTFHEYPKNASSFSYRDGKVFYQLDGEELEYPLKSRIVSVLKTDGWFQMFEGYSIRIENGIIVEFMLGEILPSKITNIPKAKIEAKFGRPSEVKENYKDVDGSLLTTDFNYSETKLRISYDDWDKKISHVNIGKTMNKKN